MAEPLLTAGVISIAITNISAIAVALIRSRRKNKLDNGRAKNLEQIMGDVTDVKKCVGKVDKNVDLVAKDVKNQQKHCCETTTRFEKEIRNNRGLIIDHIKADKG